ncbi:TetR/AcrR family transcriptional regulator [Actinoplanes sp. TRM 88003]|uniref:TetR/AcrR family transcriptional regulator n=1 Tax=Paractinoplanes aksuensis TaxID=2939490 RepID=A0ABT1DVX3_9ACTN|nr:TetR/AcrR family transcriptional regulator [Actinoplanes aksuensis]MCO8274996.1 TetR/AcrR family transcriptional regulator [Actinoplanes aksuensis]
MFATTAMLGDTGYARMTIEAIAARAGVGKATIYRWWPAGKSALVLDALAENVESGPTALPDTGDLEADLRGVVRATVAEFADPLLSATTRALTVETLEDDELAGQVRDRLLRPHFLAVRERLEVGREAGQVRAGADLDHAVESVFGPIFHRWLLRTGPLTDEYADGLVEHVMAAIRPGSA